MSKRSIFEPDDDTDTAMKRPRPRPRLLTTQQVINTVASDSDEDDVQTNYPDELLQDQGCQGYS